ncbi:MAG: 50S ribosomal protein L9, partial [Candidatus Rokuibacteriota bacterium]
FGSVTTQDLADFLARQNIPIEKRRILVEEPIKGLGEFVVPIRLHPEVTAQLKVVVVRE